jgi:DNA helicase II / ATP-dependent DNA helicase PcrA
MTNHTREQLAIIGATQNTSANLTIEALAGTGKTTTLISLLPKLKGTIALQAFNRAIADELKAKTSTLPWQTGSRLTIGTVHSFGLRALKAAKLLDKPRTTGGKLSYLLKDMFPGNRFDRVETTSTLIRKLTSHAKNAGIGLGRQTYSFNTANGYLLFALADDLDAWNTLAQHFTIDLDFENTQTPLSWEEFLSICQRLLETSNQNRAMIDFDDMVYLPLLLLCDKLPTFDNLLIDEAQDISPTRRALAFRSLAPEGRLIAVGDRHQAIYGFTGAATDSLDSIRTTSHSTSYPLTICWRCDDAILDEARKLVPAIRTRPNAEASGKVQRILIDDIEQAAIAGQDTLQTAIDTRLFPSPGDAILCRLNKPIVTFALMLLKHGQRVRIEGRDLGGRLLDLVRKSDPSHAYANLSDLAITFETWAEGQINAASNRQSAAAHFEDEASAATVLIERCLIEGQTRFSDLENLVKNLFDDNIPASQFITLSSVHKAKGREWPHVWLLGRGDYMPFHRAPADWELEQEQNLIYVAITRAERQLTYITDLQSWVDKRKGN